MREIFPGVFESRGRLFTVNLVPGERVYGEQLVKEKGKEYRAWDPFRSKMAATMKKGLKRFPVKEGSKVLYLGIAEGTTASHFSDLVGEKGIVAGIDISEKSMKRVLALCEKRSNLLPLLLDANQPEKYAGELEGIEFDVLYQDVSQRNQADIFNKNARLFLKKGRTGLIAIKAQSVSSTRDPKEIFKEQEKILEQEFTVLERIPLAPFDKDHLFLALEKR